MNRIKELRTAAGMKQSELASLLHIGRTAISNYEVGIRTIDTEMINRLCEIFDCSADYLLCRSDRKKKSPPVRPTSSRWMFPTSRRRIGSGWKIICGFF